MKSGRNEEELRLIIWKVEEIEKNMRLMKWKVEGIEEDKHEVVKKGEWNE